MVLTEILTDQELKNIEELKDITENSFVDNIEVFCYVRLYELITEEKNINYFSNEELLKILMQMKSSIDFLESLGFISTSDNMITKAAYKKIKNFFLHEIKTRNSLKS